MWNKFFFAIFPSKTCWGTRYYSFKKKTLKIPFFRHSFGCLLVCSVGAPLLDVTSYAFAIDSLPLNAYLVYLSWKFYQEANSSSSRKLFRYTLIHLPLLMILMFISRKRAEIHAEKLWKIRKKWGILLLSHFFCHEESQDFLSNTVKFCWKIPQRWCWVKTLLMWIIRSYYALKKKNKSKKKFDFKI